MKNHSTAHEKAKKQRAEISPSTPGLEWAVSAIGLAIVTMMLAFIGYSAYHEEKTPPNISVQTLSVEPSGNGFLVRMRAENKGATTAAGLTIEGVIKQGSKDLETSTMTFDYLPAHSTRDGGVFFTRNPGNDQLELRALGYQEP